MIQASVYRREFGLSSVVASLLLAGACDHPGRPCVVTSANADYSNGGFQYDQLDPPCPYSVGYHGAWLTFDFRVLQSGSQQPPLSGVVQIANQYGQKLLVGGSSVLSGWYWDG